jgi:hypothetical protein
MRGDEKEREERREKGGRRRRVFLPTSSGELEEGGYW